MSYHLPGLETCFEASGACRGGVQFRFRAYRLLVDTGWCTSVMIFRVSRACQVDVQRGLRFEETQTDDKESVSLSLLASLSSSHVALLSCPVEEVVVAPMDGQDLEGQIDVGSTGKRAENPRSEHRSVALGATRGKRADRLRGRLPCVYVW